MKIETITVNRAEQIIETRLPLGLFMCYENQIVIGIDNSTGNAWTEEFKTVALAIEWLFKGETK